MINNIQQEKNRPLKRYWLVILLYAIFLVAISFFSHYILAKRFLRLSNNFEYSANIISLDNFYDENTESFIGDKRSVTTYEFVTNGSESRMLYLQNILDIRTIDGLPIINVKRDYEINRYSWEHSVEGGDKRPIYLFGPHLNGTQDTFLYRHVNYDTYFEMRLVGEDIIDGLSVNRYVGKVTVDQTNNLNHLSGVPNERGVSTDGHLELYIEPFTGWLVKYIDNGTAYYYDQQTKERLNPWNKFSNRYTKASIENQVVKAKALRRTALVTTYGIPAIVALLGLLFSAWRNLLSKKYALVGVLVVALACVAFALFVLSPRVKDKKIVVGISKWVPANNTDYDDNIQGFKDSLAKAGYEEGKNIEYILEVADASAEKQKAIAQKFLELDVDLIFSQTTPGTTILRDNITDIPIVFSIVTYPVESGLIASNKSSGNNLVGTRNWIPANDHIDNFLKIAPDIKSIGFVHRTGETNSTIQLKEFEDFAAKHNISVIEIDGVNLSELTSALEETPAVDSIFSACDTLVQGEAEEVIIAYAKELRIPSFSCNPSGPKKGDLIALTANFYRIGELSGERAALILEGISPSALTTDTVNLPDLIINNSTAGFLDINIPQDMIIETTKIYD